jgi:hypothetical protein
VAIGDGLDFVFSGEQAPNVLAHVGVIVGQKDAIRPRGLGSRC